MPNATPAEALAEFKRRVAELRRKAKKGGWVDDCGDDLHRLHGLSPQSFGAEIS
jgi:hypothetical protein